MPIHKKSSSCNLFIKEKQKNHQNLQIKKQSNAISAPKTNIYLNHIIEVTEQYDTQRFKTEIVQQSKNLINKNEKKKWKKIFDCIKYSVTCCFKKETQFSIVVKEEELIRTIEKLKTQNIKCKPLLPPLPQNCNLKTLVLDIDQNLVFSSQNQLQQYDFQFQMPYKKGEIKVYSKIRFGLESFLYQMSKIYEIVIFTTNLQQYVIQILKKIDKKQRISHVLYKDKCLNINKVHFLKSMKTLGRKPQNVVFIDHNLASGLLQPKNFLHIRPYSGEKHDRELIKIIPFLKELSSTQSVIPVSNYYEQYCNREIRLTCSNMNEYNTSKQEIQQNINDKQNNSYTNNKDKSKRSNVMISIKKKYSDKKMSSQIQSLTKMKQNRQQGIGKLNQLYQQQEQWSQQSELSLRPKNLNVQLCL